MKNQNIELDVLVNNRPVKTYGHSGRTFMEAKVGSEYSLRIRNNNSYRVLVVVSVDGIDVIDGREASYDGRGYIIPAFSAVTVKGYRKDLDTVGAFKFAKKKSSYAKGVTGSTKNVGVISVAAFAEKITPVWVARPNLRMMNCEEYFAPTTYTTSCSLSSDVSSFEAGGEIKARAYSTGGASAMRCSFAHDSAPVASAVPKFEVGSTWGQKTEDKVTESAFNRATQVPFVVLELFYDSRQNLEEIGIDFEKKAAVSMPCGFPGSFATPPAGWP